MTPLALGALGWLLAALAMATLWAWLTFSQLGQLPSTTPVCRIPTAAASSNRCPSIFVDVAWTALVACLAILDANLGSGAWAQRSAIGWMMGSWGARLVVHLLYAPRQFREPDRRSESERGSFWRLQAMAASAAFFALPALFASINPDPTLSTVELAASGLWIVGFAGQTTADRQRLRFSANPANAGLVCRTGLWRYSRHATALHEVAMWVAYALFATASPWGWIAIGCPVVRVYSLAIGKATGFHAQA